MCVAHKTKTIEIWDVSQAALFKSIPVKSRIKSVEWSPFNPKVFLLISEDNYLQVYNHETCQLIKMADVIGVTVAKWHPRR